MQLIPLDSSPNQVFQATLSVDGQNLTLGFNLFYNETADYWVMKLFDPSTDEIILDDVPLVINGNEGENLLSQYEYLELGKAYLLKISPYYRDYPDADTLGTIFQLVWGDN